MLSPFLALPFFCMVPIGDGPVTSPEKDISCKDAGQYIGGIDRVYKLTITGPKDRKWDYSFALQPEAGNRGNVKASGTYDLIDDLAMFTGKRNNDDVRFGLNYGFLAGKVEFNGFFAAADDMLRYHRKWFHKVGSDFKPAEEIVLTMPRTVPAGDTWRIAFKGEHIKWDGGKETRTKIDETLVYKRVEGSPLFQAEKATTRRIPYHLIPRLAKERLEAAVFIGEFNNGPAGFLRGFNPVLADLQGGQ